MDILYFVLGLLCKAHMGTPQLQARGGSYSKGEHWLCVNNQVHLTVEGPLKVGEVKHYVMKAYGGVDV
jgi:hypothetical protein